jgi:hypothetical protein
MTNEELFLAVTLNAWKANIDRADLVFSNLTPEQLMKEVAPGKNRLIYLLGHLTAVHDRMLPLLGLGSRLHPELDLPFITSPDKAIADVPSVEEVRKAWNEVNRKLAEGFAAFRTQDWLQRHASVSEEDFAKEPLRNRLAILLSRTSHISYHLGQAALVGK